MDKIFFFSDNTAPAHPKIMQALMDGNTGHAVAYGLDEDAKRVNQMFEDLCGRPVDVMYLNGGTGGNILAMDSLMNSYEALICADCCHIHTTEMSAFEKIVGAKIYPTSSKDGKINLEEAQKYVNEMSNTFHHNHPSVVSIAQTTEVGTVYSIEEIKAVCDFAHKNGLKVHMDGARISNALAYLGCTFKEMCVDTGVDVVTFGGTKNGLMFGEANLYFDKESYKKAWFLQKQDLQVISKRRYLPLQFEAFLKDDLYLDLARHANSIILEDLKEGIKDLNVQLSAPLQSNQAFLILDNAVVEALSEKYAFAVNKDLGEQKEIRLVASFITTHEEMESFVRDLRNLLIK